MSEEGKEKTNQEEIIILTLLWYEIVGLDHHKDRDCHWHIRTTYSYGDKPTYHIEHEGYVYDRVYQEFDTYEEAEYGLIAELKKAIQLHSNSHLSEQGLTTNQNMKFIKITTGKAIYHLPLEFVAKHRAEYYKEDGFDEEVEFVMNDEYEGIDWLTNNMDFEDFQDALVKVGDVEVEEDWANCKKEIITQPK